MGCTFILANLQVCNATARSTQGSDSGGEGDACDDRLCHPIMNKRASFTTIAVDRPALSEGAEVDYLLRTLRRLQPRIRCVVDY